MIGDFFATYQDLFLLYLLHRFTKHQEVSVHGQFLNSLFVFTLNEDIHVNENDMMICIENSREFNRIAANAR